ncbi:MAG: hypothetical protein J5663_02050 [Bacteroidaceae bacterium]|nr:hypothetical protein [Bacteroidaceae bacterium]
MVDVNFSSLGENAQRLLCLLAYQFSGSHTGVDDIHALLEKSFADYDADKALGELLSVDYIADRGYSWYQNSRSYEIRSKLFLPALFYTLEKRRDLVAVFLNMSLPKLTNYNVIRHAIAQLVDSDYTYCGEAQNISRSEMHYLLTIDISDKTRVLFANLNKEVFIWVLDRYIQQLCEEDKVIDIDLLNRVIDDNINLLIHNKRNMRSLVNIYRYFVDGTLPSTPVSDKDASGIALAAIHYAVQGNYNDAAKYFALAFKVQNPVSEYKNMFINYLMNYFLILTYAHEATSDSRNKMHTFVNKKEVTTYPSLCPSKLVAEIMLESHPDVTRKEILSNFRLAKDGILAKGYKSIYYLLAKYTGIEDEDLARYTPEMPNLAILRHEMSSILPFTEEDKAFLASKYGTTPALTSIHCLSQWELAIRTLRRTLNGEQEQGRDDEGNVRLMYVLESENDDYVEVREQNRLKNGEWGKGKQIAPFAYKMGNMPFMNEADKRIHAKSMSHAYDGIHIKDVITEMVPESRLYVGKYSYQLVNVTEDKPYIIIDKEEDGFRIRSNVNEAQLNDNIIIRRNSKTNFTFTRLTKEQAFLYKTLLNQSVFPLEAEQQIRELLPTLGAKLEIHSDLIEGGSTLNMVDGSPVACLQITPHKGEYYHICIAAKPLHGGKKLFALGKGEEIYIDERDGERVRVKRNIDGEKMNLAVIRKELERIYKNKLNFDPDYIKYLLDPSDDVDIMEPEYVLPLVEFVQDNPNVMYAEWPKQGRLNLRKVISGTTGFSGSIQLSTRGQWFEVEGEVRIDENTVLSMSKLLDLVNKSKSNYIRLENGDFVALGDALRRQLSTINSISARDKGNIRISPFSAALLDDSTLDGVIKFDVDDYVRKYRRRILDSSEYSPAVSKELKAELRPYQLDGYQWIARLNSWGAGALLADDMGLGKTIQSIAFFLLKADEGPTLVVAPASVAPNWMSELEKFAPSLSCKFLNSELSRKEVIDKAGARDVVVTTYGLLLSVQDDILKKEWKVACLDEAHIIKNRGAKTSGVAMKLNAENRIMLTGTPIQNHLSELWSLFQFVNPGLLGGYSDFSNRFVIPIERDKDEERQEMLERVVHPFMLRRTKNAVLKELPEKTEIYQTIQMSNEENAIYEVIRMRAENMLRELGDEAMDVNVLAEITRLRQASCSAQLVEPAWEGPSSKITALIELLSDVIEGGNRALVFSQFTSFLSIVRDAFDKEGIEYLYIDGSTPVNQRTVLVNRFQKGECPVFIISLKAGGLGLNLTGANYVFHLDPWWNPAIEQQATDRAYRIGQRQAVTVYHLIAQNTIEEKIIRLHERKRALAENILDGTEFTHKLTGKEMLEMVAR